MRDTEITTLVGRAGQLVAEHYVFGDVGAQLRQVLDDRLAAGRYAAATTPADLSELVTEDLQSVNGDRHLRLSYHPEPIPDGAAEEAETVLVDRMTRLAAETMGGVARVERLDGNVGYLDLNPILFPPSMSGGALTAAMTLLAGTAALLVDVRNNRGGDPSAVQLVCGYLFDEPTLLVTMHSHDGDRQSWSLPYVPGARFGGTKPVYVLTSADTFSGAEELTYDLQQHGRATIVGERTGGGAHPRSGYPVHPHLEVHVPTARPMHPVSGTNWEGCGIIPDIEVPAADAFDTAYRHARDRLAGPAGG